MNINELILCLKKKYGIKIEIFNDVMIVYVVVLKGKDGILIIGGIGVICIGKKGEVY